MANEPFFGNSLTVAREFRQISQKQLASEVAASPALISLCEAGKKENLSRDLVEAFGSVLGFQPDFFFCSLADPFLEEECSFRHRRAAPERLKAGIRAHATLIGIVLSRLRLHFKFPDLNLPSIPATTADEIETAADSTRRFWGIGVDGPITHIGRVLERAGVVVVSHVVNSPQVDAFSRLGKSTIIFLNKATPSRSRWVFDVGHECGHLVIHRGIHTGSVESEAQADRFASAMLMPSKAFSREFGMRPFTWEHTFELKRRWRVSAAAIVRRAYDLGILGAVQYRRAFQYMSFKGWRTNGEPFEPDFKAPELLATALAALGTDVDCTVSALCEELHFLPETFADVTGVAVPTTSAKQGVVIPLRAPARS